MTLIVEYSHDRLIVYNMDGVNFCVIEYGDY